jgi:hypothetical protein
MIFKFLTVVLARVLSLEGGRPFEKLINKRMKAPIPETGGPFAERGREAEARERQSKKHPRIP